MSDEDELLDRLGRSLDQPVPPADPARVAAIRAAAEAAAAAGSPSATVRPIGRVDDRAPGAPTTSRRALLRLGAAAAGGIAAGAAGVFLLSDDEELPAGPPLEAASVRTADGVVARADMIDHTWGLEVLLEVSGLEPGGAYEMTFESTDGRTVSAGGFVGTDATMKCRNNGALLRADTARFVVTGPDGSEALSADLA